MPSLLTKYSATINRYLCKEYRFNYWGQIVIIRSHYSATRVRYRYSNICRIYNLLRSILGGDFGGSVFAGALWAQFWWAALLSGKRCQETSFTVLLYFDYPAAFPARLFVITVFPLLPPGPRRIFCQMHPHSHVICGAMDESLPAVLINDNGPPKESNNLNDHDHVIVHDPLALKAGDPTNHATAVNSDSSSKPQRRRNKPSLSCETCTVSHDHKYLL